MMHGTGRELHGKDGRPAKLTDVYDLMSPYRFKSMAGKPKLVIIQACTGSKFKFQKPFAFCRLCSHIL